MKVNFWKMVAIGLVGFLVGLLYSGRQASAQYGGQTYNITSTLGWGPVSVTGAVFGFSCAPDVSGELEGGGGNISSDVKCYILTK